jgi:phosphatidylserine decarboxylase
MAKPLTSALSTLFGKIASKPFTPKVQHIINRGYVKLMGLDMSEFQDPTTYETLNKLFTRALVTPRQLPEGNTYISPVDALITDFGTIEQGKAYQIKGMSYDIATLLGTHHKHLAETLEEGLFINYYLSPKDYHRYHMPLDLEVTSLTHIPGKLYPVNFPLLKHKKDLFIENERVILECRDTQNRVHILVLVGALNVGKMVVSFEPAVQTNSQIREPQHYTYKAVELTKGELFGWFEMGSTILHFAQKGAIDAEVTVNQKVSFAQTLGHLH